MSTLTETDMRMAVGGVIHVLLRPAFLVLFLVTWPPGGDAIPEHGGRSMTDHHANRTQLRASPGNKSSENGDDPWAQFADIPDGSRMLPFHLVPYHYNLLQQPDIYGEEANFSFSGQVEIFLSCVETTDRIYLHHGDLQMDNASVEYVVDRTRKVDVLLVDTNTTLQLICFTLSSPLQKGTSYVLRLDFRGPLWSPSEYRRRFYWSSFSVNATDHYIASTHFSPVDARHAFPCFDEPRFKVTFNISVARQPHMTALSNMHLDYSETRSDGYVMDHFHTTPLMPTYLVAFMVCDLPYIETTSNSGVKIRIWVLPHYDDGSYILPYVVKILEYMEDVTGIPYNLNKLDIVGGPTLDISAMENWGLVMFTIDRLIVDINKSQPYLFLEGFTTMVHELTHMWFGNLVTPDSWSQVWLKEGFASYFQYRVMDALYPTWDAREIHLLSVLDILDYDTLHDSPALLRLIADPAGQRQIFTPHVYFKGAAIVLLMERSVSRNRFDRAIRKFLQRNQYKAANVDVLWQAFNEELNADSEGCNFDAKLLFEPWLTQPGYPSVSIEILDNGSLRVRQAPMQPRESIQFTAPANDTDENEQLAHSSDRGNFTNATIVHLQNANVPELDNRSWAIPLFISEKSGHTRVHWIRDKEVELSLGVQSVDDFLTQLSHQGFYRINFTEPVWDRVREMLMDDHLAFTPMSRARFMSDAAAYAKTEGGSMVDWFRITEYMWKERDPFVWKVYLHDDEITRVKFLETEDAIQRYMQRLLSGIYLDMGFKVFGIDQYTHRITQPVLLEVACRYDVNGCRETAHALFTTWIRQPSKRETTPPEWLNVMFRYGTRLADARLWEETLTYVDTDGSDFEIKHTLRNELGENDGMFERYLEYISEKYALMLEDLHHFPFSEHRHRILWSALSNNATNLTMTSENRKRIFGVLIRVAKTDEDFAKIEDYIINPPTNETWLSDVQWEEQIEARHETLRWEKQQRDERYNSTIAWMRQVVEASAITSQFTSSSVMVSPIKSLLFLVIFAVIRFTRER